MPPFPEIPPMESVAITTLEQNVWVQAILDHIGSAPLAGDHRVVTQMPPKVVGQILRSALDLPFPKNVETLGVHHEDATGPVPAGRSQRAPIDAVGAAMYGVRRRVTGTRDEFVRLDHPHNFGACRIRLCVDDMNSRGADAGHDEISAFHVRVRSIWAEAG